MGGASEGDHVFSRQYRLFASAFRGILKQDALDARLNQPRRCSGYFPVPVTKARIVSSNSSECDAKRAWPCPPSLKTTSRFGSGAVRCGKRHCIHGGLLLRGVAGRQAGSEAECRHDGDQAPGLDGQRTLPFLITPASCVAKLRMIGSASWPAIRSRSGSSL